MEKIFDKIYIDIKKKIEKGIFNSNLPSENSLKDDYNCSRNTIRRVTKMLSDKGYIIPKQGKGYFIIYNKKDKFSLKVSKINSLKETNNEYETEIITFDEIIVDDKFEKITGFKNGESLFLIKRIRKINNNVLIIDTNYFSKNIIPDLNENIAKKSIYEYIEKELNIFISTSFRKIYIEQISKEEKKYFEKNIYNLVVMENRVYSNNGEQIEFTISKHHPYHFVFEEIATRKK